MKDRLFKLLGIEAGEESVVSLLLTQSVFLGIFIGAFDISAHSFFLSVFDEKMMARGYVLSGLAGIVLTSLYTLVQRKTRFQIFAALNLVFITLVTIVLWLLLKTSPGNWVIWLIFIMLGPLNILALLGFWGTTSRLFTLRQGKRLFGLVDAGLIVGIILSSYAIPVLLAVGLRAYDILLICAGGVLAGSIIQGITGSRFKLNGNKDENNDRAKAGGRKRSLLNIFRQDSYIRTMGLFVILSVMTAFFVQYSFMAVTREQYPAEEDMARFLGLFTGSMMIFTLLIKLLAFSYLIRNYGLRICLLAAPVLIGAFTIIAAITGLLRGYIPAAPGFMLFFMLLAMSRLFSKSLKDSLESPSLKVVYQTVDEKHRYEVQSGMDGTVNEIAALSSGLILTGLGLLSFFKLIHFSFVLIIIAGLWILIAMKLYSGYRNSIRKALEAEEDKQENIENEPLELRHFNNRFYASLEYSNDYFGLITGKTELLQGRSPWYYNLLVETAESEKDINLLPALQKVAADTSLDEEIRQKCGRVAESLDILVSGDRLESRIPFPAREILYGSRTPQTTEILRLLRDKSEESKQLGIYMIGKFRIKDMIADACQFLHVPGLEDQAAIVLESFGEDAREELQRFSLSSSGNVDVTRKLIRLLGSGCINANTGFLFTRLWSNSRLVKETVLGELMKCKFTPAEEERDRLHQLISDVVGILTWNLTARVVLKKHNETDLYEALEKETERWNTFLFGLLSITYDPASVARIRENLEGATLESVNYALEMVDMVIDDSVKPRIIPLLDIIPDEDKIKQLYQFYPAEIPDHSALIENIINRDFNFLGIWIRACTLRNIQALENEDLGESVVALLFSPDLILREEAAGLLARSGTELYTRAMERIPSELRNHLNSIVEGRIPAEDLIFEKTEFLSSTLDETDKEHLLFLAASMVFTTSVTVDILPVEGGFILWTGINEDARIIYGKASDAIKIIGEEHAGKYYLVPLRAVKEFCSRFPEKAGRILNYIEVKGN